MLVANERGLSFQIPLIFTCSVGQQTNQVTGVKPHTSTQSAGLCVRLARSIYHKAYFNRMCAPQKFYPYTAGNHMHAASPHKILHVAT